MDWLASNLFIQAVHATTAATFLTETRTEYETQFWPVFAGIASLLILISLAAMVLRKVRGISRRPH